MPECSPDPEDMEHHLLSQWSNNNMSPKLSANNINDNMYEDCMSDMVMSPHNICKGRLVFFYQGLCDVC